MVERGIVYNNQDMGLTPLPIDGVLPQLLAQLREREAVVLRAPTGAGKTTRVPPAILRAGLAGDKQIVMLEPRRIAARAAARRMAEEMGVELGAEVGYQVRFERKASRRTRILVVTEGLLVRMLQDDPFLEDVGVVVFDEFHERSLHTDLALALTRRVQADARPDLKLVVMSATLATEELSAWLGNAPIVVSEGRLFPVDIQYSETDSEVPLPVQAAAGAMRALQATRGDVLVFLPGVGEIIRTHEELAARAERAGAQIHELYGDLAPAEQDAVLRPGPRRKIVLSTNVAETSVTIEGVSAVVDTGLARVLRFDVGVGLDRLELERISRASADQRAGRAGRTQAGVCLRLWTERAQRSLSEQDDPELMRVDLCASVLQLLSFGEHAVFGFPWFQAPQRSSLERALLLLTGIGAAEWKPGEETATLTALGRELARFPLHPRLARLLHEGQRGGVLREAALVGALLSERDPFARGPRGPRGLRHAQHHSDCDVWDRVLALEAWEAHGRSGSELGELNKGAANFVLRARDGLVRDCMRIFGEEDTQAASDSEAEHALRMALLAAYPDRVVARRSGDRERGVMVGGRGVRLSPTSAVQDGDLYLAVELDAGRAGERAEAEVRLATRLDPAWLDPALMHTRVESGFDPRTERVGAWKRRYFLDLLLEESQAALTGELAASALAAAARQDPARALPLTESDVEQLIARLRCLRAWIPQLAVPEITDSWILEDLESYAVGKRSFEDLKRGDFAGYLRGRLDWKLQQALDREAPARISVPTGSAIALQYEAGKAPVLAVRIQEVFGLAETPRIAGGRVKVLMHLLAPNYRPQQVTDDLASFWKSAYFEVRKDLRARYPKHSWPEDPWNAPPVRKGRSSK